MPTEHTDRAGGTVAARPPRPPAILIRLELEAPPTLLNDCLSEAEEDRLVDWLHSHAELLRLITRAIDLRDKAKAA